MFDILFSAFLISVILLGIHSYFGIEIIKRGIIFTDLAVGQTSAIGAAISLLILEGAYIYPISLVFSLLAGLLISIAVKKVHNVEAFIGLLYAFSLALVFILLSKSPHGAEEFQNLMATDIIFTPKEEIYKTGSIYLVLGILTYFSLNKLKGNLKELVFFLLFSITVTSSVKLAGVLVVFSLLISPAIISSYIPKLNRVTSAWIFGTIINVLAIYVSYQFDLPTGYTIVAFHTFIAGLMFMFFEKKNITSNENS
ncbi:MAG: metal ABC transporter permease [Candidatus Sericytochromatia bacterium]